MGVQEEYKRLAKKYSLPDFEKIDNIFEISTIESENFLLREIRRKIAEKIESYAKILDDFLQPDTNLSNIYESRGFSDEERSEIFKLYQRFMFLDRLSVETSIHEDDAKSSAYITDVFKEWDGLIDQFLAFLKKAKESWLKETDIKEEVGYLG